MQGSFNFHPDMWNDPGPNRHRSPKTLALVTLLLLGCGSAGRAAHSADDLPVQQLLEQNCSKCHNSTDWAGGVAFDTMSLGNIHGDAEVWEKAVRKLRGRLMPPPGETQPDNQTITSFRFLARNPAG